MRTCGNCGEPNPDRARFCQACGRPLDVEAPVREVRKTVTVLFADVTGSTGLGERLDAEPLRRVMTRFFEEMAAIVERHDGTVEKFIGDAVMAVFGVPVVHEDDALRAVRAATEMRAGLRSLNGELRRVYGVELEMRVGVNTGEVVAGDLVAGQRFVAGDAVNVAARLEQGATPGEILIGEGTYRLVRDVVVAEATDLVRLRGRDQEVRTYRLDEVRDVDPRTARGLRSPIVGRAGEITLLREAFELSASEGACYLFTILGSAGVGKSRLTEEALDRLGDRAEVLAGRCLPYGEGITFWPVREVVWRAAGVAADADAEGARRDIAMHLAGDEQADRVLDGLANLIGLAGATGAPEESFWAFRRFLEIRARRRPLIVVFDDIHWAEPGFLDLVAYLADFTRGPILLMCMARPDLLEARPAWGAGRQNSMTITLSSLSAAESEILVDNLLGGRRVDHGVRRHVVAAAEGNPFFIEEVVRLLLDDEMLVERDGLWVATTDLGALEVPATISAILAARLERLEPGERALAQRASVVGKVFYWGAVAELTPQPERSDVARHLQSLMRKELIATEVSPFSGEDAFRFRHLLIRDAAYQAIPKEERADLHESLAGWVAARVGDRAPEFEEIIGHHLEQAARYRLELGPADERSRSLALRASERLASSGRRALARRDAPAAARLLERAVDLLPSEHPDRAALLNDLARSLIDRGDLRGAREVLDRVAAASPGPDTAADAALSRLWLQLYTDPEGQTETIRTEVERLVPVLSEVGDERGLARASYLLVELDWMACRYAAAAGRLEEVADHAARVGDRRQETEALGRLAAALVYGPIPVEEAIRRCQRLPERARGDRRVEAGALAAQAELEAMLGRFEGTAEKIDQAEAILEELGLGLIALTSEEVRAAVHLLAGDPEAAEQALRRTYEALERAGERGMLSTTAAELAEAHYEQGRLEEAERYAAISEEAGASDDVATQLLVRGLRAKLAARRGASEEAETLARSAVDLAATTEAPTFRGHAWLDLAEVLRLTGRAEEAAAALESAAREFEAKGNLVSAALARDLLTAARA
ncbi:MAG TPA: adenylate/guanylate cyclase domain-containing protein [Actinomycetota bacterium]|nr:adenylate/guanylate cyclase domain-containing protein [Actinomycetota bacterium]